MSPRFGSAPAPQRSDLWLTGADASGDQHLGLASGTNPDIIGLKNGGYEVAFQAAGTDDLWLSGTAGPNGNRGYGLASGTSPALVAPTNWMQ